MTSAAVAACDASDRTSPARGVSTPDAISASLAAHYAERLDAHGAVPEGVDWGPHAADHALRLDRMLDVLRLDAPLGRRPSLLDVGCGFGSLLDRIHERELAVDYHGVDVAPSMVEAARARHADGSFAVADGAALALDRRYDFVVCNGVLTQKLHHSIADMSAYAHRLLRQMYAHAEIGMAFNVMSTHVNFMAPNLYYRSPIEVLAWCMAELSPRVRLDHAYPLYEYTVIVYRDTAAPLTYGAHRVAA